MKRLNIFLMLVFMACSCWINSASAQANVVNVPDTNLAAALRTEFSLADDAPILEENMETLRVFSASRRGIVNLTGLETATGLTDLTLWNNQIEDLSPLSGLTSLTQLTLNSNAITDVSPLRDLTGLRILILLGNDGITNPGTLYKLKQGGTAIFLPPGIVIPDAVVFTDTNLEAAVKSALRIAEVDPILEDTLLTLESLTATRKGITDLTGLEEATGLTDLDLGDNAIVTLNPLSGLTSLTDLDLGGNEIVDVSGLSGLSSLESLDLADNLIENVSSLPNLSSLETLDLRDNNVMDVTPLSTMTHLTQVYLRGNDNVSNIKELVKLKDAGTRIDITLPRPVTFRDENLAAALRSAIGLQTDDPIFPEDMEGLTTFTASNWNIETLTGLETATGLTSLTLSGNEIVSLSPLSKLVDLETLDLSNNAISSISSLSRLTSLTTLNLSENDISSVSSLSRLTSLTTLNLSDNKIVSVSSLSGLTSLTDLDLSNKTSDPPNNGIRDVLPLQALSSLRTLDLSGNADITNPEVLYRLQQGGTTITGVTVPTTADLVTFTNASLEAAVRSALRISTGYPVFKTKIIELTRLTATRKGIDNLTGLEEATGLTDLDLGDNAIVDLGPLRSLTSLEELDLADNQIENVSPLSGLTSLTDLDLGDNLIVNVSLQNLPSLESLDLADNLIENVSSLPSLSSLETLDLRDNDVMDVTPLSTMTHLTQLYLRGNDNVSNIKELVKLKEAGTRVDITLPRAVTFRDDNLAAALRSALSFQTDDPIFPEDMAGLTTLNALNESIVNLTGLETATGLTTLTLSNNQIVSLSPLSRLSSLVSLDLSNNVISSISSLTRLTNLTTLNLSSNRISSLSSLTRLMSLTDLDLSTNAISSVSSLSGLTNLTDLNLSTNRIRDVLPLQELSSLRTLNLTGNTGITNAEVLYRLRQGTPPTTITGVDVPETTDLVAFENADLEATVRSALRISRGYPVLKAEITRLTRLTATRKGIDDLTGLEEATNLTTLDLGQNEKISDLSPLSGLTSLTTLDLADNEIAALNSLSGLTALTSLNLAGNDITNVSNLQSLNSLQTLDLRNNNVGDVRPLSALTTLRNLYLRGNTNLVDIKLLVKLENTRLDITLPRAVTIPDAGLAAALRLQIGLPVDDPIFPGDMEGLTTLTATNRSIVDLTGIETATGLTNLTLSNNDIDDLEPLEELTTLTDLNLSDNEIEDLELLEELTSLERLDLRNNQITDVSPLAELTSLTRLDLTGNSVTNPGALYHLDQGGTTIIGVTVPSAVTITDANLEAAVKRALRIATADPILPDKMATLTRLTAARKGITSLSGLEDAGLLETLDVGQNDISDLRPLSGLTHLETLDLADNNITEVSVLSGLMNLDWLDLRHNDVTDTALLSAMTHLRYLYVRGNENLADLKQLVRLKEAGTQVDITLPRAVTFRDDNLVVALRSQLSLEIDAPIFPDQMATLTTFDASTRSDIVNLTGLETATTLATLNLSGNQIVSLSPLSKLVVLASLDLSNNAISSVSSLSKLSSLTTLNLSGNKISSVSSLSKLSSLTTLNLSDNKIVSVSSLSGLSSLTALDLSDNRIKDVLPLQALSSLRTLNLSGNTGLTAEKAEVLYKLQQRGTTITGVTVPTTADLVAFTNASLEAAVRSALRISTGYPVSRTKIGMELTRLTATRKGIDNLTGLEFATGLTDLDLGDNAIVDLGPLQNLTSLEELDLADNQIVNLSPLQNLTSLTDLNLDDNLIENVSALSGLSRLEKLYLRDNNVMDVRPLSTMTHLKTLYLRGNENTLRNVKLLVMLKEEGTRIDITLPKPVNVPDTNLAEELRTAIPLSANDLIFPEDMEGLTRLTASNRNIADLTGLETATAMTSLTLSDNAIVDLEPLEDLTSLTNLDLRDNEIVDVSDLSGLTSLASLNLADNQITNVLPLAGLTQLTLLDLTGNAGITNAKVLYRLEQGGTNITLPTGTTIPDAVVFTDANLESAVKRALRIATADPILSTDITRLTRLTITRRSIISLRGLETATALENLDVGNNQIADLSLLQSLTSLRWLDLADNQIADVTPLTGLTSLERLDLRNNQITDVTPLTGLTSLTRLYLRGNENTLTNRKLLVKLENARVDIPLPDPVEIPDTNLASALRTELNLPVGDPIFPEDMKGLRTLRASNRIIADLTGLETATAVTSLTLSNNAIVDLTPLSGLTTLTTLNLSNNQITDVSPLVGLTNLTRLDLTGNTGILNLGVLYHLNQQSTTTIVGVDVPDAIMFTDNDLEAAVKRALRIPATEPILPDALATLERLTASRKGITSLSGLQDAGVLKTLDVGQNAISDLSPLSGLTNLETLDLAGNQITTVLSLTGLTQLKTLDLRSNSVTDVEPLKDLTSLRQIYLRGNTITNLEWLGALENLRSDIRLPDVVSLPDSDLDREVRSALRTDGNTVSNTLPMSEELLESLTTLTAPNSSIANLTGCEHMTGLTSLNLSRNQITDVTPLSKLTSLVTLRLDGNTILDTSSLYPLTLRKLTDVDITINRYPSWDVNQNGRVDKVDLYLITLSITGSTPDINDDGSIDTEDETAADVNRDGSRNINDLRFVFDYLDRPVNLGAPLLSTETVTSELSMLERMDADGLRVQLQILRMTDDGSLNYRQTVAFLQAILAAIQPNQTLLLANYPNPFNPETWIPYQLARDSHVRITIYDTQGAIVRRLELGYRAEGYYTSRGRAAHWDGRNDVGESVASGIYFYQLETENVSLLRKMVILK